MANIEITNNTTRTIVVWDPVFDDDIVIDAGGATYLKGTLLGRITASGKLSAYASGNIDGSEIPIAVLLEELVLGAATDIPIRPVLAGRLRRGDLVAHGVGAIDQVEADQLRDFGIIPLSTTQLAELDNQ